MRRRIAICVAAGMVFTILILPRRVEAQMQTVAEFLKPQTMSLGSICPDETRLPDKWNFVLQPRGGTFFAPLYAIPGMV
jgi:hypothetical protein